jgi:hypothetical protein
MSSPGITPAGGQAASSTIDVGARASDAAATLAVTAARNVMHVAQFTQGVDQTFGAGANTVRSISANALGPLLFLPFGAQAHYSVAESVASHEGSQFRVVQREVDNRNAGAGGDRSPRSFSTYVQRNAPPTNLTLALHRSSADRRLANGGRSLE